MMARLLHVSDLHVGAHDEGRHEIEAAVTATVGELGGWALARGETADPVGLVPLYLRPSEAELARERRQAAGRPH